MRELKAPFGARAILSENLLSKDLLSQIEDAITNLYGLILFAVFNANICVHAPKNAVPEIQQVFLSASEISEQKIMSLKLFNKNKSILRFFIDELRSLISFLLLRIFVRASKTRICFHTPFSNVCCCLISSFICLTRM